MNKMYVDLLITGIEKILDGFVKEGELDRDMKIQIILSIREFIYDIRDNERSTKN